MREPSQWNTIIAISHAVLLFTGIFTAMFTGIAVALLVPVTVVRWTLNMAKNSDARQKASPASVAAEQDLSYELAAGYAIIQRLARHTSNAWPTTRV